nr:MAG: ORF1 [TTV-like mini virus]
MAYFYPRRRYYWRRRNWAPRRRARRPFRRRYYNRRRVRNRKLSSIILRQFQPPNIRKCHIKGIECLCMFNEARLPFNSVMYKESFVPENYPGGGGFTVMKFTLQNLYEMHKFCTNWWTESNLNLPLCRYIGCSIKFYQSAIVDYVVKYSTELPAISNKLTYPSTQPSMLMMSRNKIIVPSRKTKPNRKPYTKIYIKPPAQLQNKWYFQKDLRETPLLILYAAPTTLNQYYINTEADNNNITITYINPQVVTNRQFNLAHWPSKQTGTTYFYIYIYTGLKPHNKPEDFECQNLIPLTNIKNFTLGQDYQTFKGRGANVLTNYCTNIERYTGNPFTHEHLQHEDAWFWSTTGPQTWAEKWKTNGNENAKVSDIKTNGTTAMTLTAITHSIILKCRYNPFKDNGKTTQMYLLKCIDTTHTNNSWEPPDNPDIILEGFPLWLNVWGYLDFQIRLGALQNIYSNTILVFKNETTDPKITTPIIPIDLDFLNDKSPYQNSVNPADEKKWFPQVQYQTQQLNNIALTGPGSPKLYQKTSEQITIKYDFYFKWGGNPPKMVTVNNPTKQNVYPIPSDEYATNSLQSPAQAIETMLYSFDERHTQLTKRALERISQDWDITNFLSPITETTGALPAQATFPQDPQAKETKEKEKEEIFQQLLQHKQQQQQLRLRILQLMKDLEM